MDIRQFFKKRKTEIVPISLVILASEDELHLTAKTVTLSKPQAPPLCYGRLKSSITKQFNNKTLIDERLNGVRPVYLRRIKAKPEWRNLQGPNGKETLDRGDARLKEIKLLDECVGTGWHLKDCPKLHAPKDDLLYQKEETKVNVDWSADEEGGGDAGSNWPGESSEDDDVPRNIELPIPEASGDFDLWAKILLAFAILGIGALYGSILPL